MTGGETVVPTAEDATLLSLVTAETDLDEAAEQLATVGVGAQALTDLERLIRRLARDPSTHRRTIELIERTRELITDRTAEGRTATPGPDEGDGTVPPVAAVHPGGLPRVWRHELATPLAVASLAVETLAAHADDPAVAEQMLTVARRNLRSANHVLEGLDSLEDLRAGRVELSLAPLDLGDLVRECVRDVGPVLHGDHEVTVTADPDVEVLADTCALRQILTNLLTNAAKFSPEGAPIAVAVSVTPGHAQVAVRDHGPGIPAGAADRIFGAGQRLDETTEGTGLGLFVARQLARAHGGHLDLESPPTGGSRFVLRLPRSDERATGR